MPQLPRRRSLLLAAALIPAADAFAQAYPSRPVRLVVPFPAGGGVDIYARTIQPGLAEALGQPVIVENRPGAAGMLGSEHVTKAAPDGYTLVVGNISTLAMNAAVYRKMPYDPARDFAPVMKSVTVDYVLVTHPDVPARTLPELVAYAKAHPGKLGFGTSGAGSAQHMAAEMFKARTGVNLTHVPYKGTGEMVNDLVGGHVSLAFADQASMIAQVRAGRLRLLAVGGLQRSPDFPATPTIAEAAGLPGYEAVAWQGVAAPAGTPMAVLQRVNDALRKVHDLPAVREKLAAAGLHVAGGSPEEFAAYIRAEIAKWTKLAREIGATAD